MANNRNRETSTSTGEKAGEIDDTMRCGYEPCGCEEADIVSGARRFCSESCAEMATERDADVELAGSEEVEEESCLCGHAECEASVSAGAGAEGERGRHAPRTPPGRG